MGYTLQQAADATGKNRSTIQRAIKKGIISASLTELGAYDINPAELHRVYKPVAQGQGKDVAGQQRATGEIESENRELRAKVDLLREMVDDLKERLDAEADERRQNAAEVRRLTLLITDQRQPDPPPVKLEHQLPALLPPPAKDKSPLANVHPFLWGAIGAAITTAAVLKVYEQFFWGKP